MHLAFAIHAILPLVFKSLNICEHTTHTHTHTTYAHVNGQAMASFSSTQAADKQAAAQHERELQAVKVPQEDVALVAQVCRGTSA
jgi:NACalpha-BTF3-like transcription factor